MGNPVVHFEVVGKDETALQTFYSNAFGWRMERPPGSDYAMAYPDGGSGIDGGVGKGQGTGHVTFYVAVDDLEATLRKIESLGGRRLMGPEDVPGGPTIAMFSDPEGHTVGLVKAGPPR